MHGKITALFALAASALLPAFSPVTLGSPTRTPIDLGRWIEGPTRILLVSEELELVDRITGADTAAEFVDWFWRRRDPDPSTTVNEFRADFVDRLAYVNREFADRHDGTPGWATARGQIYLLLGSPRGISESTRPVFVDGALRRLTVWEYPHPRNPGLRVRFSFVPTRSGIKLAATSRTGLMSASQADCLDITRTELINSDIRARFSAAVDLAEALLPTTASVSRDDEGVLVTISMSLASLFGDPDDGAIRYRFTVESRRDGDPGQQISTELGTVEVRITPDEFRNWSDQRLHILLWAPPETRAILLTEVPTGRTATIPATGAPVPPGVVEIGRTLAVTTLAGDRGVAIAYFPTCPLRHPDAEAIIVDAKRAVGQASSPLPGGRLALALPRDGR